MRIILLTCIRLCAVRMLECVLLKKVDRYNVFMYALAKDD
jgi:hypothetical protein